MPVSVWGKPDSLFCCSFFDRERERLQDILISKKGRKWTILDTLKDIVSSLSPRSRRGAKPGVSLDKLIAQIEDHEVRKHDVMAILRNQQALCIDGKLEENKNRVEEECRLHRNDQPQWGHK